MPSRRRYVCFDADGAICFTTLEERLAVVKYEDQVIVQVDLDIMTHTAFRDPATGGITITAIPPKPEPATETSVHQ